MRDGGRERGGPVEAEAGHEADGVTARLAVAFDDGDLAHVLLRVEAHQSSLDWQFQSAQLNDGN